MGQGRCAIHGLGTDKRENKRETEREGFHKGRGEVLQEKITMGSGSSLSSLLLVELCLFVVAFVYFKGRPKSCRGPQTTSFNILSSIYF